MADSVLQTVPLGFQWATADPFLFCVHHVDDYPAGNDRMGPVGTLAGREIGNDFAGIDGWRMYHGTTVPGFPQHPHRGFETVTFVRSGLIDHSDSLGATARFGRGDVQWLTAGQGHRAQRDVPVARRERAEPGGALPDLAQSAGRQQDGRAVLHDVVERGSSASRGSRRRRTRDRHHRDRRRARRAASAAATARFVGIATELRSRDLARRGRARRAVEPPSGREPRDRAHRLRLRRFGPHRRPG